MLALLALPVFVLSGVLPGVWVSEDEARAQTAFQAASREFPEVPRLDGETLWAHFNDFLVIDLRLPTEYRVAHIKDARSMAAEHASGQNQDHASFSERLAALRPAEFGPPTAFTCAGSGCRDSYLLAHEAMEAGFDNIYVLEDDIWQWLRSHPELGTLLGKTPADPRRLISAEQFAAHCLAPQDFLGRATDPEARVFDVRDPGQRGCTLALAGVREVPVHGLSTMFANRVWREKPLLFVDASEDKVRWLQYFLEAWGYRNYWFLCGGMDAVPAAYRRRADQAEDGFMGFETMFARAAQDPALQPQDVRLLVYLLSGLEDGARAALEPARAMAELGLAPRDLQAGMRRLAKANYLHAPPLGGPGREPGEAGGAAVAPESGEFGESFESSASPESPVSGEVVQVQLNPALAWKGRANDPGRHRAMDQFYRSR